MCVGGWHGLWVQTHTYCNRQCSQGQDFDSFKVYIVQFEDLLVRTHYSTIQCLKLGFKKDLGIKIDEICVVRA